MSFKKIAISAITIASLAVVFMFVDLHEVGTALSHTDSTTLAIATSFILASNILALLRFRTVLGAMKFRPTWRELFFAFSIGQVSSQFILSIIGQSLTRAVALVRAGVPFGASITATYIERLMAAGILFAFSILGLFALVHRFAFDLAKGAHIIMSLGAMGIVAIIVAYVVLRRELMPTIIKNGIEWLYRLGPGAALTVLAHAAMLAAYAVVLYAFDYEGSLLYTAAALTIVMFAASLPISFAGWGIRELSAATALSIIGCPPATAIAVGLIIGALSFLVMTAVAGVGVAVTKQRLRPQEPSAPPPSERPHTAWDRLLILGCALFCAVFVFFQLRVPVGTANLTINVADLGAVTGLGTAVLLIATRRITWPVPLEALKLLAVISGLLVFGIGLAHFYDQLGNWALVNRGVGWIVILGYVATMATLVRLDGERGLILALKAFAAAGVTVCALQLIGALVTLFVRIPDDVFAFPLQGFAGNQNAFALQLAMVGLALVVLLQRGEMRVPNWLFYLAFALISATIYYGKSRTGLIFIGGMAFAMAVLSRTSFFPDPADRRRLVAAAAFAIGMTILTALLPYLIYWATVAAHEIFSANVDPDAFLRRLTTTDRLGLRILDANSETERWQTIYDGLQIWLHNPLLGGGLGAFVEWRLANGKEFDVIHSTPVWLLAEFGIIGSSIFTVSALGLITILRRMFEDPATAPYGMAMTWALLFTAAGALVHDFAFQRVFWLIFGLFCALQPTPQIAKGYYAFRAMVR